MSEYHCIHPLCGRRGYVLSSPLATCVFDLFLLQSGLNCVIVAALPSLLLSQHNKSTKRMEILISEIRVAQRPLAKQVCTLHLLRYPIISLRQTFRIPTA